MFANSLCRYRTEAGLSQESFAEKAVYRSSTYIILGVLILIACVCWFIGAPFVSISIIVALLVLSIMLVLGKLKNLGGTKN